MTVEFNIKMGLLISAFLNPIYSATRIFEEKFYDP